MFQTVLLVVFAQVGDPLVVDAGLFDVDAGLIDVDAGTLVDETYLLKLEREAFCHLIAHPKTHERILGMLNTGKPVRN